MARLSTVPTHPQQKVNSQNHLFKLFTGREGRGRIGKMAVNEIELGVLGFVFKSLGEGVWFCIYRDGVAVLVLGS